MKCVCDADEVAVSHLNGWFRDNCVSYDYIIICLRLSSSGIQGHDVAR
jgi:hypothetical protein